MNEMKTMSWHSINYMFLSFEKMRATNFLGHDELYIHFLNVL